MELSIVGKIMLSAFVLAYFFIMLQIWNGKGSFREEHATSITVYRVTALGFNAGILVGGVCFTYGLLDLIWRYGMSIGVE